ncbi:SusC/RagA family TonB-linked outer membrane protein [Pedobacter nyackensis]|uniref:TonB-linked outer membrane protein, SusC/RagA family n=1 Tax=Pedobacter nyackensis TaxID=475255 RepID=A0A1W2EL83_9SPHI|nr:SusC/RagA family TonB-linked outer membrane protein [Pedobacter nyackensis]SMD10405.1 TonB-linked outer membrane protein, SusC/RagA family [Pedobacter nyackensis]
MKFYQLYSPDYGSYINNQLLRIMKLTVLIITLCLLQVSAATKAQTITLNEKNARLEKIIKSIRDQTGYDFIGNADLIKSGNPVTINVKNASINEVLKICLGNQPLSYTVEDKTIIIKKIVSSVELIDQRASQIQGTVISDDGEIPLGNATIIAVGTDIKAYTDKNGRFSINIPESVKVLRINYVGYESRDYKIDANTKKVVIRLSLQNNSLNEVVVRTGIYKRPVENFTGSAKTITAEELKRVAPSNILAAIGILDPSFRMPEDISLGSDPNRLPDIELRGQNNFPDQSVNQNSSATLRNVFGDKPNAPLFVLDGFQVTLQRIFDLDMNRVERITILKDAAATSIYGSRASNGVVVIDTRQPKEGSVRISYRGGITVTAPDLSSYDMMNAAEKLAFEKEVGFYKDSGAWPYLQTLRDAEYNERLKAVTSGVDTYWLSQPLQTGYGNSHSLYLEGGDQVVRYGINLSSQNDVAVMKGSGRDRISGGVNLTYRNSKLLFGNDLSINNVKGTNSPYGSFADYTKLNQYWSPYDENGQFARFLGEPRRNNTGVLYAYYGNPLYNAALPGKNFNEQLGFTNNFRFEWSALNWLRFMGGIGYTHNNTSSDYYLSARNTAFESQPITERGRYTKSTGKTDLIDANLGFDIRKTWKKNLVFFTGSINANEGKEQTFNTSVIGFPNEKVAELIFASKYDPITTKPSGSQGISRLISGRMNANYAYDNKYLLDFSVSLDASSQFGKDRSVAPFWSAGMGWNIHREKFMEDVKFISFLKIRGSVGTTGDQNFPPYMALSTYTYFTDQFYLNQLSASLFGYGNSTLGWQKSLKRGAGLDATLWNNRISFSGDFYYNTTNDLILDITTPPSLGFSSYKENAGALRNIGWQGSVNVNIIQKPKEAFYWRAGLSAYGNTNTITQISNTLKKLNDAANLADNDVKDINRKKPKSYYQENQSLTALYVVRSLGIDPANGQEIFLDANGNATYVWNSNDKVAVGDTRARVSGTLSTGVDYKGFGVNIYMTYRLGADLYNQTLVDRIENADITYNLDRRVSSDRWKKPGDRTFFKGIIGSADGKAVVESTLATSRFVQKEYMIEASRVSFSYQFPEHLKWLKQARLSNTRLELYFANPFQISTIKRERGLDFPFAHNFTFNISTSIF